MAVVLCFKRETAAPDDPSPAARTAVDLAGSIRKDQPQQAEKLLKKVLEATQEETVRQQAQMLLGEAGN